MKQVLDVFTSYLSEARMWSKAFLMLSGRESACQSLDWENPLEREMATHSSILAWEIPWTGPGRLQSMGSQKN